MVQYKKPITYLIVGFVVCLNILLLDRLVLPRKFVPAIVEETMMLEYEHESRYGGHSRTFIGEMYFTDLGQTFSLERGNIDTPFVEVEETFLFHNITGVKTINEDYSEGLISGFNGLKLYFLGILALSLNICAGLLLGFKKANENILWNSILFNGFLLFVLSVLYIYVS